MVRRWSRSQGKTGGEIQNIVVQSVAEIKSYSKRLKYRMFSHFQLVYAHVFGLESEVKPSWIMVTKQGKVHPNGKYGAPNRDKVCYSPSGWIQVTHFFTRPAVVMSARMRSMGFLTGIRSIPVHLAGTRWQGKVERRWLTEIRSVQMLSTRLLTGKRYGQDGPSGQNLVACWGKVHLNFNRTPDRGNVYRGPPDWIKTTQFFIGPAEARSTQMESMGLLTGTWYIMVHLVETRWSGKARYTSILCTGLLTGTRYIKVYLNDTKQSSS